jgi:hypothetical protein
METKFKVLVGIAILIFIGIIGVVLFGSKQSDMKHCELDSGCVLSYVGNDACAPCDFSDTSFQCVSREYAEKITQERLKNHGKVFCSTCFVSRFLFRCTCKENNCIKTLECDTGEDCYSESYKYQYKCIDNKCAYPSG